MTILITVRLRRGGLYEVATHGAVEEVFYTVMRDEANKERNRRCERWAEVADKVEGQRMPESVRV